MHQLELFVEPLQEIEGRGLSIAEQFALFHVANPHVYREIVRLARWLRTERGFQSIGMKAIFEQLRWSYRLKTKDSKWKLNNNYTAHYARLVMEQEPDLAGFFPTREHAPAPAR